MDIDGERRLWAARGAGRDALLDRVAATLGGDERVVAAWLGGSLGRGTADAWSDIDVWAVVEDGAMGRFGAERDALVAGVGAPLLTLDAPQNAPPGGGYLLALYPGWTGPLQVDWSWLPRSSARVPRGTRVLFDRVDLAAEPSPEPTADDATVGALNGAVAAFWVAMCLAGKAIARDRAWDAVRMTDWAIATLAAVGWRVERGGGPRYDDLREAVRTGGWPVPGTGAAERLALLRDLCRAMATVAPRVAAVGGDPKLEAGGEVVTFIDRLDAAVAGGWIPT